MWAAMNRPSLTQFLSRLQETTSLWRPTLVEVFHDFQAIFAKLWGSLAGLLKITATLGWLTLFLVSVAAGFGLKVLTQSSLTIGHEDYRLVPAERLYALNTLRERALAAGANLTVKTRAEYPACTDETGLPSL